MGQQHFRVSSATGAQRVREEHPAPDPRTVDELKKHATAPKVDHFGKHAGLGASSGGGFEVHLQEFTTAVQKLANQCDEFTQHMTGISTLDSKLPDGWGPIASVVGHAFNHRLGPEGGMRYAVRAHLQHLDHIVTTLQATVAGYRQIEDANSGAIADPGREIVP